MECFASLDMNIHTPLMYELITSVKLDITGKWQNTPQVKGEIAVFRNPKKAGVFKLL